MMVYVKESCRPMRTRAYNQPICCEMDAKSEKKARTKGFLLQDEENGIDEFEVLEIVVDNIIEL